MNIPTAADLRADPRIDWAGRFGLPVGNPDPLTAEIGVAWVVLEESTGQDFETMDVKWNPIILRATTYQVVYQAAAGRGDFTSLLANTTGIQSFTVPGYSETRAAVRSLAQGRDWFFNEWRPLDQLIWLLATQTKRDEAIALAKGINQPFLAIGHGEENPRYFGIERIGNGGLLS